MNYFQSKKVYFLMLLDNYDYSADYIWEVKDDGTAVLILYIGNATKVGVPSVIGGYEVSEIAATCFCENDKIEAVKIPNVIDVIG